jgi:hypothetical protein
MTSAKSIFQKPLPISNYLATPSTVICLHDKFWLELPKAMAPASLTTRIKDNPKMPQKACSSNSSLNEAVGEATVMTNFFEDVGAIFKVSKRETIADTQILLSSGQNNASSTTTGLSRRSYAPENPLSVLLGKTIMEALGGALGSHASGPDLVPEVVHNLPRFIHAHTRGIIHLLLRGFIHAKVQVDEMLIVIRVSQWVSQLTTNFT